MTKLLLNLVIMGILFIVLNWIAANFLTFPMAYSLPISILLSVTIGFFIYTLIDNRIG